MKKSWIWLIYLLGACIGTLVLFISVQAEDGARGNNHKEFPADSMQAVSLSPAFQGKKTTTATLSLQLDLTAVSAEDALGELQYWAGGGQMKGDQPYSCNDARDFSFAQPTLLDTNLRQRSLLGRDFGLDSWYADLNDAHLYDALPVWHTHPASNDEVSFLVCGLAPNSPVQIALRDAEGTVIYTSEQWPQPIRDEAPNSCGYSTSGLPQDFCYWVAEAESTEILPWELSGAYQVEVSQNENHVTKAITVAIPTEPVVYHSPRAKGYVLAGFNPHEQVKIIYYEGAKPIGTAILTLDGNGAALLTDSEAAMPITIGVVRDDLSIISSTIDQPTIDFNALVEQNLTNAVAYFARAHTQDELSAIMDFNTAIMLDPAFVAAYLGQAEAIKKVGDTPKALQYLNKAIQLEPSSIVGSLARAKLYMDQEEWSLAITDLSAVLELEPSSVSTDLAANQSSLTGWRLYLTDFNSVLELRAQVYQMMGSYDLAIADYQKMIELAPSQLSSYFSLAQLYVELGGNEQGSRVLKQAIELAIEQDALDQGSATIYSQMIELDPDWMLAYYARGSVSYGDSAIADFTKAIELEPDFVPAYRARAQALADTEPDQAIADYASIIEFNSGDQAAYLAKARLEEATGDFTAAIADYQKSYPHSPQAYQLKARLAEEEGDVEDAIANYTILTEEMPNFLPAFYQRGRLYELLGADDQAMADYTHIIEWAPQYAETAFYARARLYHRQGEEQLAQADIQQAIQLDDLADAHYGTVEDYTLAIELFPDVAHNYFLRSQVFSAQQDHERALADLATALRLEPDNSAALKAQARLFLDNGDAASAVAAFTELINVLAPRSDASSLPDLYQAYQMRASLQADAGAVEEAITDYSAAIEIGSSMAEIAYSLPQLDDLYEQRARLYEAAGQYAEAITDYEQLITLGATYTEPYYFALIRIYLALDNKAMAKATFIEAIEENRSVPYDFTLEDYNQYVELAPEYAPIYLYRGQFLYRQEEYEQAIADLTTAIELGVSEEWFTRINPYTLRGDAYFAQENYVRAAEDYSILLAPMLTSIRATEEKLAIDLSAHSNYGLLQLLTKRGRTLYRMAEYDRAIADFSRAIAMDPTDENHFLWRGYAYYQIDDTAHAIADLEYYVTLTNDQETKEEVESLLAELKE